MNTAKLFNQNSQQSQSNQNGEQTNQRTVSPFSSYTTAINTVTNSQLSAQNTIKGDANQQISENKFQGNNSDNKNNVQTLLSQQQQQQHGQYVQIISPSSALNISLSKKLQPNYKTFILRKKLLNINYEYCRLVRSQQRTCYT